MFSYNGDGVPTNIQPPSLDKLSSHTSNMGHYIMPPESQLLQGARSMSSAIPLASFHNQRPYFPCGSLSTNTTKESTSFRDLPYVTRDVPILNEPANLSIGNSNLNIPPTNLSQNDNVRKMGPISGIEERCRMDFDKSKHHLNIPNVRLPVIKSELIENGYQNYAPYFDVKSNYIPEEQRQLKQRKPYKISEIIKPNTPETTTSDQGITKNQADHNFTSKNTTTTIDNTDKVRERKSKGPQKLSHFLTTERTKNWTDTDFLKPFLKDTNGFTKDQFDLSSYNIIDANLSCKEALEAIKEPSSNQNIYACQHCGLLFRHPKRFLVHYKWHTYGLTNDKRRQHTEEKEKRRLARKKPPPEVVDEGKFPCDRCNLVLGSSRKLISHRYKVHSSEPRPCPICDEMFPNTDAMKLHARAAHTDDKEAKFMCEECPKKFKYLHSLVRHQPHHQEKKFPCPQCDKKFGSEILLGVHIKTHEKYLRGTTFHCTYCGKGFYHAYNLGIHERNHRGERPFECDICKSSYATNSSLKRHLKVSHNQNKPFECTVCHRSFISEQIQQRHTLRVHAGAPLRRRRKENKKKDEDK